ncbi:MAG: fibronectin type III domain-containing protein, partial [Clostridia bacterium]|nr:fibronectin type III domain-containing protein [Clostridia bacterium]
IKWSTLQDGILSTSFTVKNLKIGKTYSFKVLAYKTTKGLFGTTSTKVGSYSVPVSVSNTLSKVTNLKVATTTPTKVKLTWSKVDGADGYLVQKQVNGAWKNVKTTTSTSYTVTGLKTNTTTPFRVRAYVNQSGSKVYGSVSSTVKGTTSVPKIENFTLTSTSQSTVKLSWDKANVTGYQIFKKTGSGQWKKYKTIYSKTTLTFTDKDLKLGTKYYYKVRGFYKAETKTYYGSYTGSKNITASLPAVVGIQLSSITKTKAVLTWDKVPGAQGYQVYDYSSGSAVKLPTVSTNRTAIDIKDGNTYQIKVRAYTKATSNGETAKGIFSEAYELYSTPLQIKNLKGEVQDDGSVKFTWDKLNSVHGYTLYSFNSATQKYEKVDNSTENSYILKDLSGVPSLTFNVAAFVRNSGVLTYGPYCMNSVLIKIIQKPTLTVSAATATDITLSWTDVNDATSYVLEKYSFDDKAWTEVISLNSDRYTESGAEARGGLYRVYAVNSSGVRSAASNEVFASTQGISITQDGAAQTISWLPIEGADNYRILAKNINGDSYSYLLTKVFGTSAVISLTPGTIQSLSVYAYTADGSIITQPAVSELVFRVEDFKILPASNPHYDHSVNSQLLYLVNAINKSKHETATVTVNATSVVNYTTEKFYVNNTTIAGKDIEDLIELINLLTQTDKDKNELGDIALNGKETSDETVTFTDAIGKNSEGKFVSLARYIDPSDEEYAYLYASEDPSAWKDGIKSVNVTPLSNGGYKFTVELYEETFGNETNVNDAFYHPGLVTTIASLGYFSNGELENQLTTVGDTTIIAVVNSD